MQPWKPWNSQKLLAQGGSLWVACVFSAIKGAPSIHWINQLAGDSRGPEVSYADGGDCGECGQLRRSADRSRDVHVWFADANPGIYHKDLQNSLFQSSNLVSGRGFHASAGVVPPSL